MMLLKENMENIAPKPTAKDKLYRLLRKFNRFKKNRQNLTLKNILVTFSVIVILVVTLASIYFSVQINQTARTYSSQASGRCQSTCGNRAVWIADCLQYNGENMQEQCAQWYIGSCSNCDNNKAPATVAPTAVAPAPPTGGGGARSCNEGTIPSGHWACLSRTEVILCNDGRYISKQSCNSCSGVGPDKNSICQQSESDRECAFEGWVRCPPTNACARSSAECSRYVPGAYTPTPRPQSNCGQGQVLLDDKRGKRCATPTPTSVPVADRLRNPNYNDTPTLTPTPAPPTPTQSTTTATATPIPNVTTLTPDPPIATTALKNSNIISLDNDTIIETNCTEEQVKAIQKSQSDTVKNLPVIAILNLLNVITICNGEKFL